MKHFFQHIIDYLSNLSMELITWIGGSLMGIVAFHKAVVKPTWDYIKAAQERERLQLVQSEKIDKIWSEVSTNGGGSIKDAIGRIEKRQILSEQRAKVTANRLELAYTSYNARGECIEASLYFCRLIGRSEGELIGNQWLSCIHKEDRHRFMEEWNEAIESGIELNTEYRITTLSGDTLKVKAIMSPLFGDNKLLGYFGTIEKIN